jgi:hypothetical protein
MNKNILPGILVGTFMLTWLAATTDRWSTSFFFIGQQTDYYNLLVDGFLNGQLSMKAEVHPDLISPDPAIRHNAPYLLDAALYNKKYYLYYGVVPAITLLLPYSCLTGQDLPLNVAILTLTLLGYFASVWCYLAAKKNYFPGSGRWIDSLNMLLLAFGPMLPILVRRSAFYELPVAAGYACLMIAVCALFKLFHGSRHPLFMLGLASAFIGLAVGCRPNYIFSIPIILAGAIWCKKRSKTPSKSPNTLSIFLATVAPAACIGFLLSLYNYGRFDNPLDFGFKYGLNNFFTTGKPFLSPLFILPNTIWYYLTFPTLNPYFPYCLPINANNVPPEYYSNEAIHGQFLVFALSLVVAVGALGLFWRRRLPPSNLVFFGGCLLWVGLTNLAFLSLTGVRANRYMPDFQSPFLLLLIVCGTIVADRVGKNWLGATWRGLFLTSGFVASLFNVCIAIEQFDDFENTRPKTYRMLSYWGNYPSHWAEKLGWLQYGPKRFDVKFSPVDKQIQAPLLSAGNPNKTDILYVNQVNSQAAYFTLHHGGFGGVTSSLQQIDPLRAHSFEVDLGSFYPPVAHPYYDGWNPHDIKTVKTAARLVMDDKVILNTRLKSYDSPPSRIYFGSNPQGIDLPFTGTISSIEHLRPRAPVELKEFSEKGWWKARLTFAMETILNEVRLEGKRIGQPLLGSGVSGAGNLLFLQVLEVNQVLLGLDQWGAGATTTPVLSLDTSKEYLIEIFVGPQIAKQIFPSEWNITQTALNASSKKINIWFNKELVWSTPILANLDSYDVANLGQNIQGFSSSRRDYVGKLENVTFSSDELREFMVRNLSIQNPSP